jgi:NADPH-dependent curcumin reductase CurA
MLRLARGARVVICGAISQYNATDRPRGATNYM